MSDGRSRFSQKDCFLAVLCEPSVPCEKAENSNNRKAITEKGPEDKTIRFEMEF